MLPSTPTPPVRNGLALERALAAAPSPAGSATAPPTAHPTLQGVDGRGAGREDLPEADHLAVAESPVSAAIGPLEFAEKLSRDLTVPSTGRAGDGFDLPDARAGRTVHGRLGSLRVLTERIERAGSLRFALRLDAKAVRRGGGRAHAYMDCELVGRSPVAAGIVQYALCHGRRLHAGDNAVRLRLPEAIPPGRYRLVTRVWKSESRPETLQRHVSVVDSLASVATRPGLRNGIGTERSTARGARRSHPPVADAKGAARTAPDAQASEPYRDLQNPLYPGYRRP